MQHDWNYTLNFLQRDLKQSHDAPSSFGAANFALGDLLLVKENTVSEINVDNLTSFFEENGVINPKSSI